MRFVINKRNWNVKLVAEDSKYLCVEEGEEVCGITSFAKATIYLNKEIDKDVMKDTIVHELTHAYLFTYGFNQFENFNEENVCDVFGAFCLDLSENAKKIYNWVGEQLNY